MRITFVMSRLIRGGGVRVAFEYANQLQKRNHEVYVVYPAVTIPIRARFNVKDLLLIVFGSLKRCLRRPIDKDRAQPFETDASLIEVPLFYPLFAKILPFAKLLEWSIPDADIIIATAWETAYLVSTLSDRKGQKFYFVQSYEIWGVWNDTECWKKAKRLKKEDEKCAVTMADVMPKKKKLRGYKELVDRSYQLPLRKITIAEWLRQLIENKFDQRVEEVIPNGVNFNIFFKEGDRRDEAEHISVLMPYRPDKLKGFNDGLDAFARVRAQHPNTRFAVFGRRPPHKSGQLLGLPEWIEFHDIESDAQLRALYNDAHIFVLPSWIEGFPLPPMEAMACGCAVVTTDAGGFVDYLKNGQTALVVPIKDPAALARSVCRLIEDENERRRVAENGHQLIRQFTWENAAEKMEAVLKKDNKACLW